MEALRELGAVDVVAVMARYRDGLRSHQEAINRLNVYPVPDGDTGTNMALTMESVVAELRALPDGPANPGMPAMEAVCRGVAHGSLMGARGNSGVILSQLLRGMTGVLAASRSAGPAEVAAAFQAASDAAHDAVLRPVEGTILTVARAAAEGASRAAGEGADLVDVLDAARQDAAIALEHTPEMLEALARAGVVDAGGSGYLLLLDAFLAVVDGRPLPEAPSDVAPGSAAYAALDDSLAGQGDLGGPGPRGAEPAGSSEPGSAAGEELRYEVMYLLDAPDETMPAFKEVWAGIGDSIVVVGGDGLWNCHIHTNDIGGAIEAALDVGRPREIRVTDLEEQVEEMKWVRESSANLAGDEAGTPAQPHRTAVVAVATGEGIGRIFRSLGVHHLVPGGQSMNPSTAQILEVVESTASPEVVLLPNNYNIHPVAMQVCELSGKPVRVVPTSSIVEGFAALLEYDPESSADDNALAMADSARQVVPGEVTRAVRDATGPAGDISAGDYLGLSSEGVEVVAGSLVDATCGLLGRLIGDGHEMVTLIEGEGARTADTRKVTEWLAEHHPAMAVEVLDGGQPLYPYLVSVE